MTIVKKVTLSAAFFILMQLVYGQKDIAWDKTSQGDWDPAFDIVEIPSSKDSTLQKAYFYTSKREKPQPLIISLHTWSGGYDQQDPLTKDILANDWNYIHPDFRGVNRRPEAMGSPLVLADIKDAIAYAVKNGNVDTSQVHIIGVSGGGYATLCAYMQLDYPITSFSAWVPISDIEAWYWESVGRKTKYAGDILAALGGSFDAAEAKKRSPLYQKLPVGRRQGAKLYIYAGIHDGRKGPVPITHSLRIYNRLLAEQRYQVTDTDSISRLAHTDKDLIGDAEIINLLTKRTLPPAQLSGKELFGRTIYLERHVGNLHLTVFEGGHQQLPGALSAVPVQ